MEKKIIVTDLKKNIASRFKHEEPKSTHLSSDMNLFSQNDTSMPSNRNLPIYSNKIIPDCIST